jgi:ATP-dependent DNA helicase DinG
LGDILVSAGSVQITPARLRAVERSARSWVDASDGQALGQAADGLSRALADGEGIVDAGAGELAVHLDAANAALVAMARATTDAAADRDDPAHDAAARAASATAALVADLASVAAAAAGDEDRVVGIERSALHAAPIDATALAATLLWPAATVVATSGTLRTADLRGAPTFATFLTRLGAPAGVRTLAVDSPFDHRRQGLLYVPRGRVPSPKEPGWADAVVDELWLLAVAAGGRTLALFTSRAATERAADALRERIAACEPGAAGHDLEVLTQWDGSRQRLLDALRRRRRVVLCATRSFWTGIDIAGDACVEVAIDRVPFPRPDDPVAQARRQRAEQRGERSFEAVDLPAAATQLAQGVGRLIRSPDDRGVVAVLDTRLATSRWRHAVLGALPPLRRCVDPDDVVAFLAES